MKLAAGCGAQGQGRQRRARRVGAAIGLLAVLIGAVVAVLRDRTDPVPPLSAKANLVTATAAENPTLDRGKELAGQVCQTCHLLPEPALLDKFTWSSSVLPDMSRWLGVTPFHWRDSPADQRVREAGVVTTQPLLAFKDWHAISTYYLESAPAHPLPQTNKPPVRLGLPHFQVIRPPPRPGRIMTTLLKIDASTRRLFLHDAATHQLLQLSAGGVVEASLEIKAPVVDMIIRPEGFYLTVIGEIFPSNERNGRIEFLPRSGSGSAAFQTLLAELPRPSHLQLADLNGDGREDLVVTAFGNILGHFSWFERRPDDTFQQHVLIDRPGAVRSYVHDFNGDGRPDLIVMMAQAWEGIYLLLNQGNGQFETVPVVEKPPSWGFSYFELVDFDGDGHLDILATNGDNGDSAEYPGARKNYHGIRLYLNDGRNRFEEAWFYPMHGAYKASAVDFDGDGDLDIVAIAFFPDYLGGAPESFVYLENRGGLQFEAFTFAESNAGRWITFDTGDFDGDGRPDIVLGAFNRSFHDVPDALAQRWDEAGIPVLILKNKAPGGSKPE